jgi:hypothetical protein
VLACTRDGEPCAPHDLPLAVLDRLSQRIEALDPAACVSFALACPQCATRWEARLDLGGLLWRKLQAAPSGCSWTSTRWRATTAGASPR